jgi:EAL domain-containing protein (putative c-di-GMP-specific phosphodiesterase class I)
MNHGATAGRVGGSNDWAPALQALLADPQQPHLVFQPIVDLTRGVVAGYECLSRFTGPQAAPPDIWFGRAAQAGSSVDLELRVVRRALEVRQALPDDTFLTINVSPEVLASESLWPMLRAEGTLNRLVFEITEHSAVSDYRSLSRAVKLVRDAGGRVAVDDAGAGYASLRHILELRPDFVKLDRSLISFIDRDPATIAVVQMLGDFVSGLDSWVVAEGIERPEELDVLCSIGVPLAQGYLLGMPAEPWATVEEPITMRICARVRSEIGADAVATLSDLRPALEPGLDLRSIRSTFDSCPGAAHLVQLDEHGRPVGLVRRDDIDGGAPIVRQALVVSANTPLRDAATRAMQRPEATRFDPLVCTRTSGLYFGVIPLERLVTALAR